TIPPQPSLPSRIFTRLWPRLLPTFPSPALPPVPRWCSPVVFGAPGGVRPGRSVLLRRVQALLADQDAVLVAVEPRLGGEHHAAEGDRRVQQAGAGLGGLARGGAERLDP